MDEPVTVGIVRDPTKEDFEGEGFMPIITRKTEVPKSESDKYHEKVEAKAQEFRKKKIPYCTRCAYAEYKEVKKRIIEAEKMGGFVDFKRLGIKMPDLDKFGREDKFEKIDEGETKNPGRWAGDKVTFDKWIKYRCKDRGCIITIFE